MAKKNLDSSIKNLMSGLTSREFNKQVQIYLISS